MERMGIEEAVAKLGLFIDAKEWLKLEQVLSETVELDYRSLFGGQVERLPRSEVIARWEQLLSPLKATQHMITNLHITLKEDSTAECAANVQATHVRQSDMGDSLWVVGGRYDFQLKHEGQWKISAIKLTTFWTTGNPKILGTPDISKA